MLPDCSSAYIVHELLAVYKSPGCSREEEMIFVRQDLLEQSRAQLYSSLLQSVKVAFACVADRFAEDDAMSSFFYALQLLHQLLA